jgi:hypothetical protein
MRSRCILVAILTTLGTLNACGPRQSEEERRRDANTPAGKIGQGAHKVAVQADKAGREIGRKLDKAAHDAHAGWSAIGSPGAINKLGSGVISSHF